MRIGIGTFGGVRRLLAAGLVLVSLGTVAACDLADASSAPPQPKKGGTLFVNIQGGLDLLDPQRTYAAVEMNVLRLTTRTLTTYKANPGQQASEIVPDLATDTGRPSENNTVWTFTLKPGVKWEGGEALVCNQVKYGIQRRFSSLMNEGAPYPRDYLQDNAKSYEGPWVGGDNGGKGLESIKCVDERTIEFHLKQPVGDFGYTVAMSTFAPVLPEKDTQENYRVHPYANGPYKLEGDLNDKGLTLVRNKFWSETNDQVRKAYPDRIVFNFRKDESGVITNEMIEDQGDARNTIMLDLNVAPNFLQQVVNDTDLLSRAIQGPTGAVRMLAINTQVVPELGCREALIRAFNKRKWRAINGGSVTGDYATTIISPQVRAYKKFDLYESTANPEGNPQKAIELMAAQQAAGKPCSKTIKAAFPDNPLRRRLMNTVVEAYQLAGIQVQLVPLPSATYYNTGVGDPSNDYALILGGWVPDWANGSAILPPLFASTGIPKLDPITKKAAGNVNWPMLRDPKIDAQMKAALAETVPERQYALWGDLDEQIQRQAVDIPLLYEKALRLTGTNVLGGFIHAAFGMPDLCSLGLAEV